MTKILVNPFFVYILSFLLVGLTYTLGWSELYPSLSAGVVFFFILTFIVAFVLGITIQTLKRIDYQPISVSHFKFIIVSVLWFSYCSEFAYHGEIPLVMVLRGHGDYPYALFGIPTFHVFLVTFNSFIAIYFFHQLISRFTFRGLLLFFLTLIPAILIVNRGMLLMILTSCLFLYLSRLRRIRVFIGVNIVICVLIVLYLFGVMGNLRQTGKVSSAYILELSEVTPEFRKSFVPEEYIWGYLYFTSPLANFQTAVNRADSRNFSAAKFLNFEILPDFISKRIGRFVELKEDNIPRIADWLTVSTFYAGSYVSLGWTGVILMFCFFIAVLFIYMLVIPKNSRYYSTGLAILNTLVLYSTFDNMIAFSGLSLQLVYPLLLSFVRKQRDVVSTKEF